MAQKKWRSARLSTSHSQIAVAGESRTPQSCGKNESPEAQRWHAGAEGSLAQISEVSLSCVRYRVTAKSTRRIATTIQILMRDIWEYGPRCELHRPTALPEKGVLIGTGAGPGPCWGREKAPSSWWKRG